jgi:hypothetical protein
MDHFPKDGYDELMELIRYYGNIRFATLTLFAAVVAGLLAISYTSGTLLPKTIKTLLEVGGLVATAAFWIMELSAVFVWIHCARRASELETAHLQFRILSTMRGAPRFYFRTRSRGRKIAVKNNA